MRSDTLYRAPLAELKSKFTAAHRTLWESGRRDPALALDEFTKLLFAKVYDEISTDLDEQPKFQRRKTESMTAVAERVRVLFRQACKDYPGVFTTEPNVTDAIVAKVVSELEGVSLVESDLDAPGRAFEAFLGDVFKAELGQYLTPRPVVEMAISMLRPHHNEYIADPASGSGGFLLYALNFVRRNWPDIPIGQYAAEHIVGVELNERLSHLAMVTMVLHGDGHSNIACSDSLASWLDLQSQTKLQKEFFDVVVTNPPFGGVVSDTSILQNFQLGSQKSARRAQKTELLFLERCLELLRVNSSAGRMGIVLPDSVLTTVSMQYVREFILERSHVLAVVSLPAHTFAPAGIGVKASLLLLERRRPGDDAANVTFMALPSHVGYDATGRTDTNSLPVVVDLFAEHTLGGMNATPARDSEPVCYQIDESRLVARMDPFFHQPLFTAKIDIRMAQSRYPVRPLSELLESVSGGATPTAKGEAYVSAEVGVPLLRIQNVRPGKLDLNDVLYIDKAVHKGPLARSMLQPDDVLLTITGRIGTAAVVPRGLLEANINQHIVRLRVKREILLPGYLEAVLNSDICQTQISRIATGATRPALDYSSLRTIRIPLPSLSVQESIAQKISEKRAVAEELRRRAEIVSQELKTIVEQEVLEE